MQLHEQAEEKPLVGYRELAEFLTAKGYPTAKSTLSRYCSPAIDIGPPVESYWNKKPTFLPSKAIAWAKARIRPANRVRRASDAEAAVATA
jgi:hypothetical protein